MTELQKITAGCAPLVIGKRSAEQKPQTVEERLAAMEADIAEIKEMLKKALGE